MPGYLYLAIAIVAEVIATASLKSVKGLSTPLPLALVVRSIPVGIAYAIWAGLGIVLVSVAALVLYQQKLDTAALLGMGLIVSGVVVIQLFSGNAGH